MSDELFEVPIREDRQRMIEKLPLGETVAIARRVDLSLGADPEKISQHNKQVRGILDQQTHRARRKIKTAEYKVENGSFLTRDGSLIIVAVCTRTG